VGLRFAKGHGTGNDFLLLPDVEDRLELTAELARALCDRHTGLGADGVLRVAPAVGGGWFMDHRNADGSHAEMCGNGVRVLGRWLVDQGLAPAGALTVGTRGGDRALVVPAAGDVTVDMGPPALSGVEHTVSVGGSSWPGTAVDMGNPHVVVAVEDLGSLDLAVAPGVVPAFPRGVNVEFVRLDRPGALTMRVHERGVGETASCGTGACAAVVAASLWTGTPRDTAWRVDVPGGRLGVTWTGETVLMTGPAVLLAHGEVSPAALGLAVPAAAAGTAA